MRKMLDYYMSELGYPVFPKFMQKYLNSTSLRRLRYIGYFCGMDYASKDVYNFSERITRFDHSVTVALMVYKYTRNREKALAGLFHDVGSPCFCHVIDYMNGDHATQESTESFTERVIMNDHNLLEFLDEDSIAVEDIINYKKFPIVDCERPMLCADRLDGLILTGIGWARCVDIGDINEILRSLSIQRNERNVDEFSFSDEKVARRVLDISTRIDELCHSKEDNYMMELLAKIVRLGIENDLYKYEDLFCLNERDIMRILERSDVQEILDLLKVFKEIKRTEIPTIEMPFIKKRDINPLVKGKRLITE